MEHRWQKLPSKQPLMGRQTFLDFEPVQARLFRRNYPTFPAGEGDVLQTGLVPPDDPQTPDKQYGSFP